MYTNTSIYADSHDSGMTKITSKQRHYELYISIYNTHTRNIKASSTSSIPYVFLWGDSFYQCFVSARIHFKPIVNVDEFHIVFYFELEAHKTSINPPKWRYSIERILIISTNWNCLWRLKSHNKLNFVYLVKNTRIHTQTHTFTFAWHCRSAGAGFLFFIALVCVLGYKCMREWK